jgi:hypothetical protein
MTTHLLSFGFAAYEAFEDSGVNDRFDIAGLVESALSPMRAGENWAEPCKMVTLVFVCESVFEWCSPAVKLGCAHSTLASNCHSSLHCTVGASNNHSLSLQSEASLYFNL